MGEIGSRLIRAREARGLTLEDAERDTRISRRYLEALEAEQFEVIPAPVYARGFLRSYSQYLGMDPQELLMLFPRGDEPRGATSAPAAPQPPAQQQRATMETPIPPTSPSRPQWRKPPRFDMGKTARVEPRPRRKEPPPPAPGYAPAPPAAAPQEIVIGGDTLEVGSMPSRPAIDVTPPEQAQPAQAEPAAPRPAKRAKQPPRSFGRSRTEPVAEEFVIGGASAGRPAATAGGTPRAGRSAPDNQRNLLVLGAMGAILLVVVIAAFLIASLGGDDGGTPAPDGSGTGTAPAGATGTSAGTTATGTATGASTASQQGVVPDVIGDTEADASRAIEAAGLKVRVLQSQSTQPRGTVTDQSPAARTQLAAGDTVTIVVSEGP